MAPLLAFEDLRTGLGRLPDVAQDSLSTPVMVSNQRASASGLPLLGDVVARRYRVLSIVASSDDLTTFRTTHVQSGEDFALQVAPPAACDEVARQRLQRAARLMGELSNPHVAHVEAGGLLPDGAPFLVTEWLDGCTLATLLESGSLPLEVAVDFVLQACEALVQMHGRGIVHRNLHPGKLFVVRDSDGKSRVKLLGCANAKVGAHDDVLAPGAFFGPAAYRSPEELTGQEIDGRADTWALGVILFELLTRSLPFGNGSAEDVLKAIRSPSRARVSDNDPRLPPGLDGVLQRCLQAKRRGRIQHIRSLAQALAAFGGSEASAQLARIHAVARTASRLPKLVLSVDSEAAPLADESNERHSVPPTTASVRPPAMPGREREPGHPRSLLTRVAAPAMVAAPLLVALFVSGSTPHARLAVQPPSSAASVPVTLASAELPAPSASVPARVTWASVQPPVQVTSTTPMTVTVAPHEQRHASPPPAGTTGPTRRRAHPRLATTVYPEEPFNTRK